MKEIKILLLLLIPILGYSQENAPGANKSVSANYMEATPAAAMASTFEAPSVNESQVVTFQQRGIQKLKDFYNYLTIISNPAYDKRLREDAKNQAKQLFYGVDCKVNGKQASGFIDSCFTITKAAEWKVVNVSVLQNMASRAEESDSTATYYGELVFNELVNAVLSGTKKAEIILSKSQKQFGVKKKEVWAVFICSIE
jgi:hypothetical protein